VPAEASVAVPDVESTAALAAAGAGCRTGDGVRLAAPPVPDGAPVVPADAIWLGL
jgi:hypothetical protein